MSGATGSAAGSDEPAPIIVVRRPRGGGDDHHGGAWKIAYADFMTAMMALFLVLWLVNASSEETKAAVASYFNPIELTDRNARPRGLDDPVSGVSAIEAIEGEVVGAGPEGTAPEAPTLAAEAPALAAEAPTLAVAKPAEASDAGSREPLVDPFDPFALSLLDRALEASPPAVAPGGGTKDEIAPNEPARAIAVDPIEVSSEALAGEPEAEGDVQELAGPGDAPDTVERAGAEAPAPDLAMGTPPRAGEIVPEAPAPDAASRGLAEAIAAELADALGTASVEVVAEADAVVIRLADDPDRAMFALGSAVPRAGLAADLRRVAQSLASRAGPVSLHGHTDARPFRGRRDGNWRLSADRAVAARALLVRGGLDPARIGSVVAHADREPRLPDPLAAGNRRIELRLATQASAP